jgi:hypothetical protein
MVIYQAFVKNKMKKSVKIYFYLYFIFSTSQIITGESFKSV